MPAPREDLQLRTATDTEFEAVTRMVWRAFGEEFRLEEGLEGVFEPDRSLVFEEAGQIIANASALTRDLTVPGATVPAAHISLVAVHPLHRRRGLLTRLMHRQLRDVREGGVEPLAVLWASEGAIYQRFGYGHAALRLTFEADRRGVRLLPRLAGAGGGGRLREAVPGDVRKDLAALYERLCPERVGWSNRPEQWWTYALGDRPDDRHGATALHALLYETADGLQGYALWRSKPGWDTNGPAGTVIVKEVVAATPEAYATLWRFLFSVDLSRTVQYRYGAVDEPLLHMLEEPRVLAGRQSDSLWVRLADVPAALCARRYATPLDVVLEVDDALLPENAGRWRLRAPAGPADQPGAVTCVPTSDPADLAVDVADLGAAYLGGTTLAALAAAGRVRELNPNTLPPTSTAFGWRHAPTPIDTF